MPPDTAARTNPRPLTLNEDTANKLTPTASGTAQTKLRALAASALVVPRPASEYTPHEQPATTISALPSGSGGYRRERQPREPARRQGDAGPAARPRALARRDAATNHRDLHGAEKQQRARRGADAHVGERERRRVREQRDGPDPADPASRPPSRFRGRRPVLAPDQRHQHDGPHREPHGRERGGVHLPGPEPEPRQDRVRRERDQRERGQQRSFRKARHGRRDGTASPPAAAVASLYSIARMVASSSLK